MGWEISSGEFQLKKEMIKWKTFDGILFILQVLCSRFLDFWENAVLVPSLVSNFCLLLYISVGFVCLLYSLFSCLGRINDAGAIDFQAAFVIM